MFGLICTVIIAVIVVGFYGGVLFYALFGKRVPLQQSGIPGAPADNDPNEYQAH